MARQGRKPEKLPRAWDLIRKRAREGPSLDKKTMYEPLADLVLNVPMAYNTASQFLTKLEKYEYIKKHTNGTIRLVFIEVLKFTDLGEDILGKQVEKLVREPQPPQQITQRVVAAATPVQETPVEPPNPQHVASADSVSNAVKDASDCVAVLLDYENLRYSLLEAGATLDFHDLIVSARSYGTVLETESRAFVPPHTTRYAETRLRNDKFRIRIDSCPPRKPGGPDTCDQTIEESISFYLDYTNIGTFVIVSGDGDFGDILDKIENKGRKWVLFHCDDEGTSRELLSRKGEKVNISKLFKPINKPAEPIAGKAQVYTAVSDDPEVEVNIYSEILADLTERKPLRIEKSDISYKFLNAIVACLIKKNFATDDPRYRKSLSQLKMAVWQELREEFYLDLAERDCRKALIALRDVSILISHPLEKRHPQDNETRTYYVLNRNHPLLARKKPQQTARA